MDEWLWIVIASLAAILVIYPYVIYPLILKLLAIKQQPTVNYLSQPSSESLSVALLFCAFNEEDSLGEKIDNIRQLKNVVNDLAVFAYSDASTDSTNELLTQASDVLTPVIGDHRLGKIEGMKKLVAMAKQDILIFTDANVILEAEGLKNLIRYFHDPTIGCVAGKLMYRGIDSVTAKVGGMYWKLEELIKQLETNTGSTVGADGAIFARRRENYPDIPAHLVDDMAVSMQVIFEGLRCISANDVVAYENAVSSSSEEFSRKKRIACGSYLTYLYQRNDIAKLSSLNKFKYYSHKVLRWWGSAFILVTLFSVGGLASSLGIGSLFLIILAIGMVGFIALGKMGVPVISSLYEIVLSIFATGMGVVEALKGKQYATWNTAKTR